VLDLTHMLAGPYCTLLLADLGCDVIKIEAPGRPDRARSMPGCTVDGETAYFGSLNRNKRSVALDLKQDAGLRAFYRLVETAHVVVDNLRPGVTARLGIDFERLRDVNPQIVTCSITGFGLSGPRRDEPAYDYLIQALAGTMSLTGDPDGEPAKFGISIVDHSAGLAGAFAVLAALHEAERTGQGRQADVALFDTHLSMLTYLAADYLNCGIEPQRYAHSAHPYLVPSQLFATEDGFLVVMPMADHMWPKLCEALGLEELAGDPELGDARGRLANRDRVTTTLAGELARRKTVDVLGALHAAGVPAAPVNTVAEALADPQVGARAMIVDDGRMRMVGNPVKISGMREQAPRRAPSLGEHTREILLEAGLDPEEVDSLCRPS
jgi:crotonobetainyl-CoA:carnitine CoA-transferase CaiB-like acyl-CoA transferase